MKNKCLLKTISQSAIIAGVIVTPIGFNSASIAQETEETEEDSASTPQPVFVPPSPITATEVPPSNIEPADDKNGSVDAQAPEDISIDDEIDAELQAELEEIETADRLSDPDEFLKSFSLKKPLIILPTPEPDRLVVAEKIVARLFPVGTNERVMRNTIYELMVPMIDRTLDLTIQEAVDLFGLPDSFGLSDEEGSNKKIGDLVAESDPKYREKMDVLFDAYSEITGLSSEPIEPALAGAMARDYARKYTLQQLNDLDVFFSTPTGELFARDFMLSTASIDMVQTALKEFPAIAVNSEQIEAAAKRIEEAFKTETVITDFGECAEDDAACETTEVAEETAKVAVSDTSGDLGTEPWFDNDNWNETARADVSILEDTYNELAELSEQAYSEYDKAFDAAVAESRAKYIADGWTREEE